MCYSLKLNKLLFIPLVSTVSSGVPAGAVHVLRGRRGGGSTQQGNKIGEQISAARERQQNRAANCRPYLPQLELLLY